MDKIEITPIGNIRTPYLEAKEMPIQGRFKEEVEGWIELEEEYVPGLKDLDGTPLLDIKPYVEHFDHRDGVRSGWLDKHFREGKPPERTIIG